MDQQIKSTFFHTISPQLYKDIQNQQIQASCLFHSIPLKLETEYYKQAEKKKIWIQIRGNYILEYEPQQKELLSALLITYFSKFQIQQHIYQVNLFIAQKFPNNSKSFLKIDRMICSGFEPNKHQHFLQNILDPIHQSQWDSFITVLSTKPIVQEIRDLKQLFKPGKLIKASERTRIYEAYSLDKKEKFIIKAYPKKLLDEEEQMHAFLKHYNDLRTLDHPGIMKVCHLYSTKNTMYAIMPAYHCNLPQFREIYGDRIENIQEIVKRVLIILAYLHSRKISHGKIASEHILINQQNGKIVDLCLTGFGNMHIFRDENPQMQTESDAMDEYEASKQFEESASKDIEQLGKVFSQLQKNMICRLALKEESFLYHYQQNMFKSQSSNMNEKMCSRAIDLLQKMIGVSPQLRIKPNEGLQHDFLKQKYQISQNPKINDIFFKRN